MTKLQRILIIVLAAQLALTAFVFWPRNQGETSQPLLQGFSADEVVGLSVYDPNGESVSLEKQTDGWVLKDTDGFAAESSRIASALQTLADAKRSRQVANTADTHQRLQVADESFLRRVELTLASGATQTIFLGTSPASRATHARLEGEEAVFLVGNLTVNDFGAAPSSWIETLYLNLPLESVQSLTLTNANGSFELNKDASGNWKFAGRQPGEELQATRITSLVNSLAQLRMSRPVGTSLRPEYGLDDPQVLAQISVDEDGQTQTLTLRVGAQDEVTGDYYAWVEDAPYVVEITAASAQSLITLKREELVRALPTSTAPVYP